eukprot:TRINITY_DN24486_c0_g1_i1.p1 TRINITY_DN24486_c0_g1~~TRINITY_DN24486_c0_g1_i1.p1  ORF type:complete len:717 (+),score=216.87 TRINITY_DN24486_c0_g1_i1:182-2332(+)
MKKKKRDADDADPMAAALQAQLAPEEPARQGLPKKRKKPAPAEKPAADVMKDLLAQAASAMTSLEAESAGVAAPKKKKRKMALGERALPAATAASPAGKEQESAQPADSGLPTKKKKKQPEQTASAAGKEAAVPEAQRVQSSLTRVLGDTETEAVKPAAAAAAFEFTSSTSQQKKEEKMSKTKGLKDFDKQIALYASQRQLSNALRIFNKMKKSGVAPTLHTFGNVINAHVNSGDVRGAYKVLGDIRYAGLQPNVIVYTALLKGYCRLGDVAGGAALLEDMVHQRPPVMPDMRSINTFLRGCLRVGDIAAAERVFGKSQHKWGLTPDPGAFQFMGRLLSAGLKQGLLKNLQRQLTLQGEQEAAAEKQGVGVSVREGTGLGAVDCEFWKKGKCKRGAKCHFYHDPAVRPAKAGGLAGLDRTAAAAALHLDAARCNALLAKWKDCKASLTAAAVAEKEVAEQLESSTASAGLISAQRVRHREAKIEAELISKFVGRKAAADFEASLGKAFIFSSKLAEGEAAGITPEGTMVSLVDAHLKTFGLQELARLGICKPEDLERRFIASLTPEAHLDWSGVFAPVGVAGRAARGQGTQSLPLKLEVGAGTGEWAVAQAKAEAGRANWAAVELMHDRAHGIFTRMVFDEVSNLCVIAGDAARVLRQHVAPGSVSHLFSNFPEPPHLSGDEASDSSLHLLTDDFLRQVHDVLTAGGSVPTSLTSA